MGRITLHIWNFSEHLSEEIIRSFILKISDPDAIYVGMESRKPIGDVWVEFTSANKINGLISELQKEEFKKYTNGVNFDYRIVE